MLKTLVHDQIRLVQQPHHAHVSGYLAAHWGGANRVARPGHYPGATDAVRWRDAVILAIAEHDSGWSEWETVPRISTNDGLPIGLGEKSSGPEPAELAQWRAGGFDRWRQSIGRLAGPYPYAALLVSLHAYWLYAVEFDDLLAGADEHFRHFVFSGTDGAPSLIGDAQTTRAFLDEQAAFQAELRKRIEADAGMAGALAPQHLAPHLRLLQLLDSMSLYLALNDRDEHRLEDVPRASWADRVTMNWTRRDDHTVVLDPFPFDTDPLPVPMSARVVDADPSLAATRQRAPFATIHAAPLETVTFNLTSAF